VQIINLPLKKETIYRLTLNEIKSIF